MCFITQVRLQNGIGYSRSHMIVFAIDGVHYAKLSLLYQSINITRQNLGLQQRCGPIHTISPAFQ